MTPHRRIAPDADMIHLENAATLLICLVRLQFYTHSITSQILPQFDLLHPFIPDTAIDSMIYLWKKKNNINVGQIDNTDAAIIRG